MLAGFDFDVIERSLPYLFKEGMVFTVTLTAVASVQPSPAIRYWRYDPEAPGSRSKKILQFQL